MKLETWSALSTIGTRAVKSGCFLINLKAASQHMRGAEACNCCDICSHCSLGNLLDLNKYTQCPQKLSEFAHEIMDAAVQHVPKHTA